MAIVQSDKNSCVWMLTSETHGDKYIALHGDAEFISNPANAISAAQEAYPEDNYKSINMISNSVSTFEFEA
jgi:hypothetical protein